MTGEKSIYTDWVCEIDLADKEVWEKALATLPSDVVYDIEGRRLFQSRLVETGELNPKLHFILRGRITPSRAREVANDLMIKAGATNA